jgi:hypothetical protein
MRNPWFQDWLALMRMFDQKQNAMETGFWWTTKQHNNIFRKCLLNRMPIMLQPFSNRTIKQNNKKGFEQCMLNPMPLLEPKCHT